MIKKVQQTYEVGIHFVPTLSEKEVLTVYKSICSDIQKESEILEKVEPSSMQLAYSIRHKVRKEDGSYNVFNTSYFASIKFTTTPTNSHAIGKHLKTKEDIVRFLLILTVPENTRSDESLFEVEEETSTETKPEPDAKPKVAVHQTEEQKATQ